ncbi:SipW-dependent-type signal peptide-containing protein [Microbacterium sp. LTA6]|uniref:SipW-dependent-type signal peptide-containing protein n=1 Tax=unclassified Microbacterium TaxID=2609290 RepID=UPI00324C4CA5
MSTRKGMREARRLRSRRIRAVLASGLVFGVGAAMTLAAWNDSEHTTANFTAGRFGIVGATDGVAFSEHPTAPGATLPFQLPATAAAMTPGATVYALFSVRTINPSVAGSVQLKAGAGNGAGLGAHLTYSVRTITQTTCNAANFGTGTAVAGLPVNATLVTGATSSQALTANAGAQVNYCFEVTLPAAAPNTAQGLTLTATWEFAATAS